jgi:hypothetical protein
VYTKIELWLNQFANHNFISAQHVSPEKSIYSFIISSTGVSHQSFDKKFWLPVLYYGLYVIAKSWFHFGPVKRWSSKKFICKSNSKKKINTPIDSLQVVVSIKWKTNFGLTLAQSNATVIGVTVQSHCVNDQCSASGFRTADWQKIYAHMLICDCHWCYLSSSFRNNLYELSSFVSRDEQNIPIVYRAEKARFARRFILTWLDNAKYWLLIY